MTTAYVQPSRKGRPKPKQRKSTQKGGKTSPSSKGGRTSRTRSGKPYGASDDGNRVPCSDCIGTVNAKKNTRGEKQRRLVQDMLNRLRYIAVKDRPIPDTNDVKVLGAELKIRLAMTSEIVTENPGRRGGKTTIVARQHGRRHVPVWEINRQQDSILLCEVQVIVSTRKQHVYKNKN